MIDRHAPGVAANSATPRKLHVSVDARALLPFTYAPPLTGYGNEALDPPSFPQTHSNSRLNLRAFQGAVFMNWCVIVVTHACNDGPAPRFWLGIF